MDGQTKELIVAFRNLADVPKNSKCKLLSIQGKMNLKIRWILLQMVLAK
jgi:hypothetical protein